MILETVPYFSLEFSLIDETSASDDIFHSVEAHDDGSLTEIELHWVLLGPSIVLMYLSLPSLLRELESSILVCLQNASIMHHIERNWPVLLLFFYLFILALFLLAGAPLVAV